MTICNPADFSTSISALDEWYNWDITSLVNKNKGEELSVALVIKNIIEDTEEMVVFYSSEDSDRSPHLRVTYTPVVIQENSVEESKLIFIILGISIAAIATIVFIAKSNIILKTQKTK